MNVVDELKLLADAKTSIYGSIHVAQAAVDALEQAQSLLESDTAVVIQPGIWHAKLDRIEQLEAALKAISDRYTSLVNSGDCGSWNPETEDEVIAVRLLLAGDKVLDK